MKQVTLLVLVSFISSLLYAQQESVKYSTIQLAPQYSTIQLLPKYTPVQLAAIHTNDSIIMHTIVTPMVDSVVKAGLVPDWLWIARCIEYKGYSTYYSDKNVARAKIFYSWGKDWPAFATAIVYFTSKYEDRSKADVMCTNAKYVLEHSTNPKELQTAASWVKSLSDCKDTYEALMSRSSPK